MINCSVFDLISKKSSKFQFVNLDHRRKLGKRGDGRGGGSELTPCTCILVYWRRLSIFLMNLIKLEPRQWRSGLERSPRKRKVVYSNPSRD